ncbi:hypothetical protein CRE_08109 [Caenorhabditis remanei]|uniref:Protein kinase domain-containing protein n=1 Tax=Caenorhabditis remanei TaxID=31234 RepID=E3M3G2_CAERE|nr:hypothetical protein CRE_08109 [Caenorhabditis remanei]
MPGTYRTTDEITAQRLDDGRDIHLNLEKMSLLASGAFSNVYAGVARTQSNHQLDIAIKKTWPRHKGAPMEVKILGILGKLKHKNVVRLLYSYQKAHEDRICLGLIFECIPTNLHQFMKENNRKIDSVEIKLITWQLFRGQSHLQKAGICHRDIKPQNLLYDTKTGLLKISDFGSSSIQSSRSAQPSYQVTRDYRPPELLFGSKHYGSEIDIWSCGCVFGELLKGEIFLDGKSATNQAEIVMDAIGIPTRDDLSAMKESSSKYKEIIESYRPDHSKVTANFTYLYQQTPVNMRERKSSVFNEKVGLEDMKAATELIRQILVYKPENRLSGLELLKNPFFSEIFEPKKLRWNREKSCVTSQDLRDVEQGDLTTTYRSSRSRSGSRSRSRSSSRRRSISRKPVKGRRRKIGSKSVRARSSRTRSRSRSSSRRRSISRKPVKGRRRKIGSKSVRARSSRTRSRSRSVSTAREPSRRRVRRVRSTKEKSRSRSRSVSSRRSSKRSVSRRSSRRATPKPKGKSRRAARETSIRSSSSRSSSRSRSGSRRRYGNVKSTRSHRMGSHCG